MERNLGQWRYEKINLLQLLKTYILGNNIIRSDIFIHFQVLLKKLYTRRMAADLGISNIYASGKVVVMTTNMSKKVFKLMKESMASDIHRNCLTFSGSEIKVCFLRCTKVNIYHHFPTLDEIVFER